MHLKFYFVQNLSRLSFVAWRWNLCNTASSLCEHACKFASVEFRFIQNAFKGGKYLSAHCRRTDQLRMTCAEIYDLKCFPMPSLSMCSFH